MTRPGIEPGSPGPLANTLTIMPMSRPTVVFIYIYSPFCLGLWYMPTALQPKSETPPPIKKLTVTHWRWHIMFEDIVADRLVSWGCRIHQLHRCSGVRPPAPNECFGYDTKQSDGQVPVMLELWGMWSTPSLLLLPSPLWLGMVAPDRTLSMG